MSIRIFEKDPDRAPFLSEHLSQAKVLRADVTEHSIWEEEHIPESDMLLVSTGDDGTTILATLIGKEYKTPRLVSIVHENQYLSLFGRENPLVFLMWAGRLELFTLFCDIYPEILEELEQLLVHLR